MYTTIDLFTLGMYHALVKQLIEIGYKLKKSLKQTVIRKRIYNLNKTEIEL